MIELTGALQTVAPGQDVLFNNARSEERRVGKECL